MALAAGIRMNSIIPAGSYCDSDRGAIERRPSYSANKIRPEMSPEVGVIRTARFFFVKSTGLQVLWGAHLPWKLE